MLSTTFKLVPLCVMVVAGTAGLYEYERRQGVKVQFDEAQRKAEELKQVVAHLHGERRVADMIVTGQKNVAGVLNTTLLFVEYARDGSPLPAKRFTIEGKRAQVGAMVLKFGGRYVDGRDPLRGQSVALFTSLRGDNQTPDKAHRIDDPDQIPETYRGPDPRVTEFEQELWREFWRLADDEAYRRDMGVRGVRGAAVWPHFEPGKLYTIALDTDGGLIIQSQPLKGIYSEALERNAQAKASE